MAEQRLWINGKEGTDGLLPDEGLFFGRGVFETIRIGTSPWFLPEHVARLNHGAAALGLASRVETQSLSRFVTENGLRDCALRVSLTAENLILSVRPVPYTQADRETGVRVMLGAGRRNPFDPLVGLKTMGYASNLLERERAVASGCREAILLNTEGCLAEGSASNLFFVRDGVVHTPSCACGLLPGIVRMFVLSSLPVVEGAYGLGTLISAEEVFVTNSLMGVMGVRELLGHALWPVGPIARRLQTLYDLLWK